MTAREHRDAAADLIARAKVHLANARLDVENGDRSLDYADVPGRAEMAADRALDAVAVDMDQAQGELYELWRGRRAL